MKKMYEVTFDTKKGIESGWTIHIEANNAKEARCIAEGKWYASNAAHMFHIKVRMIKPDEEFLYHYFVADIMKMH